MHIYYTNMHLAEESKLPNLFTVSGYLVYFWANEGNEPIHVHISKGHPYSGSTKVWLTRDGGCILASNGSKIPNKELNELMDFIAAGGFYAAYLEKGIPLFDAPQQIDEKSQQNAEQQSSSELSMLKNKN